MITNSITTPSKNGGPRPRWFGLSNDTIFYSPEAQVEARVIKAQTGVPQGHVLVRDLVSPNDILLDDDEMVDLKNGNVFFSMEAVRCRKGGATGVPKMAWLVDDRPELTTLSNQTGQSLMDLFHLSSGTKLFRDYESPQDEAILPEGTIRFEDGPVFFSRGQACAQKEITIFVNTEPKKTKLAEINYEQVIALAYQTLPVGNDVHFTINYRKGPPENAEGLLVEDGAPIKLKEGMRFDVSPNDRS